MKDSDSTQRPRGKRGTPSPGEADTQPPASPTPMPAPGAPPPTPPEDEIYSFSPFIPPNTFTPSTTRVLPPTEDDPDAFSPFAFSGLFTPLSTVTPSSSGIADFMIGAKDNATVQQRADLAERFERENKALRSQVKELLERKEDHVATVATLQAALDKLKRHNEIGFLLRRVSSEAQSLLINDPDFQARFFSDQPEPAFVMSVDIRRSTELMLKARQPKDFAEFMGELCNRLMSVVTRNLGVFDKFTGDGILAFFPTFYSGEDAPYRCLKAAQECIDVFNAHYHRNRSRFSTVLLDVGLGIGIDHGDVRLLRAADGLTVVGSPVVYACRLSGAPPSSIFANQPAYEELARRMPGAFNAIEDELDIKHEGRVLCYRMTLTRRDYALKPPDWMIPAAPATEAPHQSGGA